MTCTGEQGTVMDTACDPNKRPALTMSCDLKKCPYWFAGEWSDVSNFKVASFQNQPIQLQAILDI